MFEHEQLNLYVDCKIISYSQTVSFLPGVSKYRFDSQLIIKFNMCNDVQILIWS